MKFNPDIHHRRSIRLRHYDYSQAGAYFLTICTHNRECLFGEISGDRMVLNELGRVIESVWMELTTRYPNIELDAFGVMPNHIHGIIVIVDSPNVGAIHELPLRLHRRRMLIPKIVGYLKMNTAKQINQINDTPGVPVWQRNYYEHIIRDEDELNRIRKYIIENPLQWQLDQENPDRDRSL